MILIVGSYCDTIAMTSPADLCDAGFYCDAGALVATSVVCPAGKYCVEGTHTPAHCPAGTWSDTTQLTQESECTPCPSGSYCQLTALTAPEGLCTQGYYCEEGEKLYRLVQLVRFLVLRYVILYYML